MERLSVALDGGEKGGLGIYVVVEVAKDDALDVEVGIEVQEGEGDIRDGPGELEVGVKGVSKDDELFKLRMGARSSTDTVIDESEEE
eukprot:g43884.t1